jgi:hypothetical protein
MDVGSPPSPVTGTVLSKQRVLKGALDDTRFSPHTLSPGPHSRLNSRTLTLQFSFGKVTKCHLWKNNVLGTGCSLALGTHRSQKQLLRSLVSKVKVLPPTTCVVPMVGFPFFPSGKGCC